MQNKLFLGCSFSIVFLVVAIACSTQKENDSFSNLSAKEVEVPSVVPGANVITDGSFQTTRFSQSSTGSANSGIHVTGFGSVSLEPDLAIMKIGIESFSKTVSEARETAAEAMDSVKATLLENRVAEKDIQTRRFNIYPRYDYEEVVVGGRYTSKQILSGYVVSNSANVKLREIDRIGEVVDDVAKAGGDLLRIEGIDFTVEDTEPYMSTLRQKAVSDAFTKAKEFANFSVIELGSVIAIVEGGSPSLRSSSDMGYEMMRSMAASPSTPIDTGELELKLTVQMVFSIK
ncbi:MAG: SIMPL domain-containing protein [Dehalococcoidia bacterium]